MNWVCRRGDVAGTLALPGDKSVSHRSVMLGAIAEGITEVTGFLPGEDCLATVAAMRRLGATIDCPASDRLVIHGTGVDGLQESGDEIYLGNSGTGMRLLAGLLAGMPFDSVLTGDRSLSSRPMGRIAEPLEQMGAAITTTAGHAPLRISGRRLHGIDYTLQIPSAQVKSAILLAALQADGVTTLHETATTRDHTERMLRWFGAELTQRDKTLQLAGRQSLTGRSLEVPGDFSAAAFFIVAALIAGAEPLRLTGVGVNPTRIGLLELLAMMGADINVSEVVSRCGEPVADIEVRRSDLRGIDVPPELVSLAIDEFPVFFIAAAFASGTTTLTGAAELRLKESDRIAVMADGLKRLGVTATPATDGISITGGTIGGGSIESRGDHRIAMAFAVASLAACEEIRINETDNVATSFPSFVDVANSVGFSITCDDSYGRTTSNCN
ncbi:MAG: 3-phosphoshikimate 1-carboxyvinyltransferase [Gammaproteobacteria bacterium]|nr:3-phosphoshikimate 1-carboxyvinyltransferase [Gammaproteobacteria bacterium]